MLVKKLLLQEWLCILAFLNSLNHSMDKLYLVIIKTLITLTFLGLLHINAVGVIFSFPVYKGFKSVFDGVFGSGCQFLRYEGPPKSHLKCYF